MSRWVSNCHYHFFNHWQIQRIRREAEDLKTEFTDHLNESTEKVGKFSEEMLLNTDDLYIYCSRQADRRADQQLLEEFDEVSSNLTQTNDNLEYEKQVALKIPYRHTGKMFAVNTPKFQFVPSPTMDMILLGILEKLIKIDKADILH